LIIDKPIDFSGIIGHEELKTTLFSLFHVFVNRHDEWIAYLKAVHNEAANSYLMLGLPGTGKSEIMKCVHSSLQGHSKIHSTYVQGSSMQGTVGTNARRIEEIFAEARDTPKVASVLLIDEIDGIMQEKQGINSVERTNALLAELEGVKDSSKLIVIGASNSIEKCDIAAVSRFKIIDLNPPTVADRKEFILRYFVPIKYSTDITMHIDTLVEYTDGMTGRNYSQISSALKMQELTKGAVPIEDLLKRISKYTGRMGTVKAIVNKPSDSLCIR